MILSGKIGFCSSYDDEICLHSTCAKKRMFSSQPFLLACVGGGKTTLLSALAGHVPTSAGTILVRGHKINKMIRRRISYVLQSDLFFANLTLRETLLVRDGGAGAVSWQHGRHW